MKQSFNVLILFALVFSLTGCGKYLTVPADQYEKTTSQSAPKWMNKLVDVQVNFNVFLLTLKDKAEFYPDLNYWLATYTRPHPNAKKAAKGKTVEVWIIYFPKNNSGTLAGYPFLLLDGAIHCVNTSAYAPDNCFKTMAVE
ncbi:MAG: hypothetical protein P8P30_04850 [Rickettsiales bacterium]|nr:hypothetical protein [Rickettsiales bacterium]